MSRLGDFYENRTLAHAGIEVPAAFTDETATLRNPQEDRDGDTAAAS